MNKDKANPTDFGTDSSAAAAIAAAKSRKVPVGGVPMPAMPRLDQAPPNLAHGVQTIRAAQRVLTQDEQRALQEQGKFIPGVGSGYAVNQPGFQAQATNTEGEAVAIDPRLEPRPPGAGLRKDTVDQLQAVAAANTKKDDDELEAINKDIEKFDDLFETNEFGERVRSLLGNKKRCAAIEARCLPLSFEDLLLNGSVQQRVPIMPGRFEPTFRSLQGGENLEILRLISQLRGSEEFVLDSVSLYRLTAGLFSINSRVLPNHLDKDGDFNEDMFTVKKKTVLTMGLPVLADLSVNYGWFTRRVQKLTVIDAIKDF